MNELLLDPFRHNQWATQTLLAFCGALSPEHLDATTEGTFGGVLATLWHIVDAEAWYGGLVTGEKLPWQDSDGDDVPPLDVVRERCGEMGTYWERFLAQPIDVEREVVTETEGDSPTEFTKLGALIAQHLNHGNEHRGQVCTILTKLGMQPPSIDGWKYASATGRLRAAPTES